MDNSEKPSFTPGPWKIFHGHIYADITDRTESLITGKHICTVHQGVLISKKEADANGNLAEAAPEMYEALKMYVDACAGPSEAYALAVAALAAAEGRGNV